MMICYNARLHTLFSRAQTRPEIDIIPQKRSKDKMRGGECREQSIQTDILATCLLEPNSSQDIYILSKKGQRMKTAESAVCVQFS